MKPPISVTWTVGTDLPTNWKGGAAGVVAERIVYTDGLQSPWRAPRETVLIDPRAVHMTPHPSRIAPEYLVYCWLPDLPVATEYTGGLSVQDAFYVLGGRAKSARRRVFRLTRQDDGPLGPSPGAGKCAGTWTWDEIAPMRNDHLFPTCAALGDTILVTGGLQGVGDGIEAYAVDRPEQGWVDVPPAPVMRAATAASARGRFYLFGGLEGDDASTQTSARAFALDMSQRDSVPRTSQAWEEIGSMPLPLRYASAVTWRDRYVIILGGGACTDPDFPPMRIPGGPIGQLSPFVIVYDADLDEYWQLEDLMPVGVATHGAVLIDDMIYVVGGETRDPQTSNCSNLLQMGKISVAGD